jgi:hypothetical protein
VLVSEYISCFACDKEPTQQCPRCGRPYCDDHGEELCDACLEPASGVPSFTLYRGSLLALLFGTLLAVWLLIQPADSSNDPRPQPQPTQAVAGNATQPAGNTTPPANTTPAGTTPPAGNTPAGPTATRPAGATPGTTPAAGGQTYTVASGDTLGSICEARKPASMTVSECVDQVVSLNGLSSAGSISIGQSLRIPSQ